MKITWSTRLVILTKTKAFKFPVSRRGWLQGINEKRVWETYQGIDMLAPLIWSCFGIVCQTRVEPAKKINKRKVKKIKDLIPHFQFDNCDLYNVENWGIYKGNEVLIDYGIDEKISKMY